MRAISPSLELHAFSYVADDVRISEERWIDLSSKAVGAHLHKIRMVSDDLPSQLDRLILRQGEPFGSSSILAQYRIFEAAAEDGIRVMLDGQGADEMLGGYSPFLAPRVASLVHRGSLLSAWSLVQELKQYGDADVPYIKRYVTASLIPQSVKRLLRGFVHDAQLPAWVNRAYLEQQELAFTAHVKDPGPDLRRHLSSALHGGLQALLRYEDRNSMAHSIESRVPFLTPSMVELLLRLPDEQIIDQRGCRKAVFRRAMRGLVPDAILDRRDKIGFQTPQAKWLDQEQSWVNGILVSEAARSIRVWNHDKMLCAVTSKDDPAASSMRTWRFLNLSRWVELNNVRFE